MYSCLVGGHSSEAVMQLTKCVTIQSVESEEPPKKWVSLFSMTSPTLQPLCELSDWEPAGTSHVLLDIDIPNQQLYHLPLLITPVCCVYLITFDLRNRTKSLTKIHSMLKTVYTLSLYVPGDGSEVYPKVLLVGVHADKVEGEDRSRFVWELNEMLKKMPYNKLVEEPVGDEPFWEVNGEYLSLSDTDTLSHQVQGCSSDHGFEVQQWIRCHHKLQEELKDTPCICYHDLKNKVASLPSGAEILKFKEFLQFLHNYGFIFYPSAEGEEADGVVLLQPLYVYQLFTEVLKLRMKKERVRPTIQLLWSAIGARIKPSDLDKKWFQRMCVDMGLVFEVGKVTSPEFVFLMGLEPNIPPSADYSVLPLLITFKEGGIAAENKGLLPSHFFAAFVTEFCKTLTQCNPQDGKPRPQKDLLVFESMEQHFIIVGIGSTHVHVVERDFCIEIGFQKEDFGRCSKVDGLKRGLQSFCKRIYNAATASANSICRRFKLAESITRYGFYHSRKPDGPEDAFADYVPDDIEGFILKCSCCEPRVRKTSPLHAIWFEEEFDFSKVCKC